MSYVKIWLPPPSIFACVFPPISPLDHIWTKQVWHENKSLTSYYSCMLHWEVVMLPSMNLVKIAVTATPDIFEKADHQNEDTGK